MKLKVELDLSFLPEEDFQGEDDEKEVAGALLVSFKDMFNEGEKKFIRVDHVTISRIIEEVKS